MKLRNLVGLIAATGTVVTVAVGSIAQQPTTPPKKPGMMSKMKAMMHRSAPAAKGQIIGNKSSKVYHLPGAGGNLPAEKNRVYFKTEAEAKAAGYHAAGSLAGTKTPAKKGPARDPKTGKFIKK